MIKKLEETGIQFGKQLINAKLRQQRKANVGSVSYTHLTLPTTPYV